MMQVKGKTLVRTDCLKDPVVVIKVTEVSDNCSTERY